MTGGSSLLTLYSDVQTKSVRWLWFPYIASGKLTLLQGDPGDGKSTMMMHIIAELSTGGAMPDGTALGKPQRIIYQCSEDGAGDTIKPRLVKMGANCKNIAFINEEIHGDLTLDDERIREAKKTEERDESTPYETTLQEESDSTIIIHPHHAVIPAAILPTPSLQDPGEAEGTGAQTDSKQPCPC